jgi:hypothetical protein
MSASIVVSGERWRRLLALARDRGDRLAIATLETRLAEHAALAMRDRLRADRLMARLMEERR